MPISHACLPIPKSKLAETKEFYTKALEPLGYKALHEFPTAVGFGDPKADFWLFGTDKEEVPGLHFAFEAKDKETVQKWYDAAIAAGAKDNGPPGPRAMYGPNYYAAFVHDLCGHNIEVVVASGIGNHD